MNGMCRRLLWLSAAGIAACSGGTAPHLRPCTAAGDSVVLAAAAYVSIDAASDSGCTVFSANGTPSTVEYLVVPQFATGVPGKSGSFRLGGDTILPAPAPSPGVGESAPSPVLQFHDFLRHGEERRIWGFAPHRDDLAKPVPRTPSIEAGPPALNDQRTFMVCARLDCSTFTRVIARVRAIQSKIAIYVDTLAPAGGLDSTQLDSIAKTFDQRLYAIDTAAFGRESDNDSNSVVLVLMTNVVNKLVSTSTCVKTGFVAGFFFGLDLDPQFRNDSRSNKGEVFYSMVADPTGKLSCSHSADQVLRIIPVTFIHEFQHMISFNQHVLARSGSAEVLWLNEGFSHYAEELGGRSYETQPDAPVSTCVIGSIPCRFYGGDLINAYTYLDSTGKHFLLPTAGIGTLAERGAAWMFVRYVVDQYAGGSTAVQWNAFTRQLLQTANTGAQNIAAVTGDPFETVVARWALANYVSDLPAFTAPTELKYDSWLFRSTFASLNAQADSTFKKPFPLVPTLSEGRSVLLTGTLLAGSGIYHRATQSPGDQGFTLQFTSSNGGLFNGSLVPRLNVIRIR